MVEFTMDSPAIHPLQNALTPSPDWAVEQLTALQAKVDRLDAELKLRDLKIQALVLELAHHRRMRFLSKSESMAGDQRVLFDETRDEDDAAITAEIEKQQTSKPKTIYKRTGRRALPADLPRIEHRHEPDTCACGACGKDLVLIGEDVAEQLDCEPTRFFVHRHIRPQYACRQCETVSAAEVSPAIIDGGLAAPGLLAWVLIQKYVDHLPLYRIEQISDRAGLAIPKSTLGSWVGQVGVQLEPLVDRMRELLLQGNVLHADETPVQQLDPGKGKTKKAYLWAYRSNDLGTGPPMVVFDYQISRAGEHARNFLQGWHGHLMVDDFGGYKKLFESDVVELGCLAHARRKFFELWKANQHPEAEEALRRIQLLYKIESEARELDVAARQQMREQHAKPVLTEMFDWLMELRQRTATGSGMAKAIDYSLKRWSALVRYAERGDLPIDNNPVENVIRPIALGRKNWLFTGSERAGKRAAMVQSLIATAKLNGIEPYALLNDVLEKLPAWPNSRIDELLPLGRPTIN